MVEGIPSKRKCYELWRVETGRIWTKKKGGGGRKTKTWAQK